MFGDPLDGRRARTRPRGASSDATLIHLFFGCWLVGCASSAGSVRSDGLALERPTLRAGAAPSEATKSALLESAVLSRAEFVRAVLDRNPSVESARQGFRAALARVHQAQTFMDPMLDVGIAPLSVASSKARLGYELKLTQQLPWFGKRALEGAAAEAEAEAARSDYEGVKRELALSAVMLYDQYFVATRSLDINAAHVRLMHTMRDDAAAQLVSGHGSAQDALEAEAELAHLEHDALVLASEREVTVAQMNELLHRAPELVLPPPPAELSIPDFPEVGPTRLQEEALQSRPDILAARQRARAEQARVERAEREYFPDFNVSTSYSTMWDMPEHRWMVGLGFNLPIQRGKRAFASDEARAMRAQFESDVLRLSDSARTQVFIALKQLEESKHVLALFETRLLPVARDRSDAARAGFITSQNTFMAVMQAERALRQLELDYQMARADHARRRAELDRALGRVPGLDWKEARP